MIVRELIEKLLKCDPEKPVCVDVEGELFVTEAWPDVDTVKEVADVVLIDFGQN